MIYGALPSSNLIYQAPYIGNALQLILLSMGLADSFNYKQEKALKKEIILKEELNTMFLKVEKSNDELEQKVNQKTEDLRRSLNKTKVMLSNINKAVFSVDQKGKIHSPVSDFSKILFGKEIVGENGLKLLFFHLKDNSEEKKKLINAFKAIFGSNENKFLNLKPWLPNKVILPDSEKKSGRILDIQYAPLYDEELKVEKIMFIVEDISELHQLQKKIKEDSLNYSALMEILPFPDKEELANDVSHLINSSITVLEQMVSFKADELDHEELRFIIGKLVLEFKKRVCVQFVDLEEIILRAGNEIEYYKEKDIQRNLIQQVENISNFLINLMRYADTLNMLNEHNIGYRVHYSLPEKFNKSIEEKRDDLERMMVNLLEYVFLVRSVKELDEEKISNAPKKARLYGEFDNITSRLMYRSRLISFLLKISAQIEISEAYMNFSNLLKHMPSKDKLTKAALINHLIDPYKKLSNP
tara:strand:- start:290 stop:1702 length:1413 start_codon:yes stop_codon:yes gene_type:complete